eukprot:gnl/TRDRNA2_/TRDRNA2_169462_c0_seq8.p1 gnl/TRDRNA2_/TRDRNA2_169462_c0~~gnl/TRDRNA2_/TRDRNA2_169462_c0_seq8.p1  ORF type:complete len:518 (-),score=47.02 gnl/TRDRNA2_/TRDRNA2_169462_c0_seq8:94-1647(-)
MRKRCVLGCLTAVLALIGSEQPVGRPNWCPVGETCPSTKENPAQGAKLLQLSRTRSSAHALDEGDQDGRKREATEQEMHTRNADNASKPAPRVAWVIIGNSHWGKGGKAQQNVKSVRRSSFDPQVQKGSTNDRTMPVRKISRAVWQKTSRCSSPSMDSCTECSGQPNCWGVVGSHGKLRVKRQSAQWNRFVTTIHVRCMSPYVHIRFSLIGLTHGVLRLYWDGMEITPGNRFVTKGLHSPILPQDLKAARQKGRKKGTKASLKLDRIGGHEFTIEFSSHSNKNLEGTATMRGLSFIMPDSFARCEDTKVCLASLAGRSGSELRNSNVLQRLCLSAQRGTLTFKQKQACESWRRCLSKSDVSHSDRLLALLEAATVGDRSVDPGTARDVPREQDKIDSEQCILPPIADPESWACDCFEEMHQRCETVSLHHAIDGFSEAMCLRAMFCSHSVVCGGWKEQACKDPLIADILKALQDLEPSADDKQRLDLKTSALQLQNRANLVASTVGVDGSLNRKTCS